MEQRTKKWSIKNFFKKKNEDRGEKDVIIKEDKSASSPFEIEVKEVHVKKIKIK